MERHKPIRFWKAHSTRAGFLTPWNFPSVEGRKTNVPGRMGAAARALDLIIGRLAD